MKLQTKLLAIDLLLRTSGTASFALFVAAVYQTSGRASDIGMISLATVGPALIMTAFANHYTNRLSALGVLKFVLIGRLILFGLAALAPVKVFGLLVAAAVQSLLHQSAMSSKMSLDATLVSAAERTSYLSRKAILSNTAIILGPPLGGVLISYLGIPLAMAIMFALGLLTVPLIWKLPHPPMQSQETEIGISVIDSLRHLISIPMTTAVVSVFCIVAVILEVQAPLLFPFVHEVYGAKSNVTGMLLGLGGLGGVMGGLLAQRFQNLISEKTIPWLVVADGLLFLVFTQMSSLVPASLVFIGLGVMGAVTLVVVEGAVQRDVERNHQPFVFSLMQFAGGAGGASLGIISGFLAEAYGAQIVLGGAAISEAAIGILLIGLTVFLGNATRGSRNHGTCK